VGTEPYRACCCGIPMTCADHSCHVPAVPWNATTQVWADVSLVFENAKKFNTLGSDMYLMAEMVQVRHVFSVT